MPAPESTVAVFFHAETDKAIMVSTSPIYHDRDKHVWLPRSTVTVEGVDASGPRKKITITAPDWLLRNRGLI